MNRILKYSLFAFTAFFAASAVYSMHHAVKINNQPYFGKYLTDTEGKTLYWFTKDKPGVSACSGGCLQKWPIFFRPKVAPPGGISAGDFKTIVRKDGKKQTTFRGYPLYYWVGDSKKGDTNGHGKGKVWFVINPDKFPEK